MGELKAYPDLLIEIIDHGKIGSDTPATAVARPCSPPSSGPTGMTVLCSPPSSGPNGMTAPHSQPSSGPNGMGAVGPDDPRHTEHRSQPPEPLRMQFPPRWISNVNSAAHLGNLPPPRMVFQSNYSLGTPKESSYRMGNSNVRPQQ